jgi:hypothetical protein
MEVLTHPILDQLAQLGLTGMAQAFAELEASGEGAALTHADWPWCTKRGRWLRRSLGREYRVSFLHRLDDRCPTRPMSPAVTGYPGRATG